MRFTAARYSYVCRVLNAHVFNRVSVQKMIVHNRYGDVSVARRPAVCVVILVTPSDRRLTYAFSATEFQTNEPNLTPVL